MGRRRVNYGGTGTRSSSKAIRSSLQLFVAFNRGLITQTLATHAYFEVLIGMSTTARIDLLRKTR